MAIIVPEIHVSDAVTRQVWKIISYIPDCNPVTYNEHLPEQTPVLP